MSGNQVTLTFAGDSEKLEKTFDKVGASSEKMDHKLRESAGGFERVGEAADEVDTKAMGFRDSMTGVQDSVSGVSSIMKGDLFTGFLTLGMGIGDLGSAFYNFLVPLAKTTWEFVAQKGAMLAHIALMGIVKGATLAWTGVQWLLNVAMDANPIGLIILGIVALIAIIEVIVHNTKFFKDLWHATWDGIKTAAKAVADWFSGPFVNFFVGAWHTILNWGSNALNWFKNLPSMIGHALSSVASFLLSPFRGAFNSIADAWNNTIGSLRWTVPSWVPGIGGNSIGAPRLPHFHSGGVVPGVPGSEMLAVLQAGERVTPAGQSNSTVQLVVAPGADNALATFLHSLARQGILQFEVAA